MQSKPLIFVVISVLVVAVIYSPSTTFYVFAVPPSPNWGTDSSKCDYSTTESGASIITCCWNAAGEAVATDSSDPTRQCQHCNATTEGTWDCGIVTRTSLPTSDITPPQDGVLEQPPSPPTPRTPGQSVLPGEGVLEQPPTPPQPTPRTPGQSVLPGGVLEQPPVDEDTQPPTLTEEPAPICQEGQVFNEESGLCVLEDCPEGQVLDEEANLCVLEEPEVADVPEQSEPEEPEQQSSEEEDSSGDNSNNDNDNN